MNALTIESSARRLSMRVLAARLAELPETAGQPGVQHGRVRALLTEHRVPLTALLADRNSQQGIAAILTHRFVDWLRLHNQFVRQSDEDRAAIFDQYRTLAGALHIVLMRASLSGLDKLMHRHRSRMLLLLRNAARRSFGPRWLAPELLPAMPCAEYSTELQLEMLGITVDMLRGSVLDIGCGKEVALARMAADRGARVWALDLAASEPGGLRLDWMTAPLPPETFDLVVSHQAFSLHFAMASLAQSEELSLYRRRFAEICHALRPGGRLALSPGLPEANDLVPDGWAVETHPPRRSVEASPQIRDVFTIEATHVVRP